MSPVPTPSAANQELLAMWGNITKHVGAAIQKVQKLQNELESQLDAAVGADDSNAVKPLPASVPSLAETSTGAEVSADDRGVRITANADCVADLEVAVTHSETVPTCDTDELIGNSGAETIIDQAVTCSTIVNMEDGIRDTSDSFTSTKIEDDAKIGWDFSREFTEYQLSTETADKREEEVLHESSAIFEPPLPVNTVPIPIVKEDSTHAESDEIKTASLDCLRIKLLPSAAETESVSANLLSITSDTVTPTKAKKSKSKPRIKSKKESN